MSILNNYIVESPDELKPKHKRKRYKELNLIINEHENSSDTTDSRSDDLNDNSDNDSNCSTTSSIISTNSGSISLKPNRIKHGHKIIITEEKVTNALENLKIQMDTDINIINAQTNNKNVYFDLDLENSSEEDDLEEDKNGLLITNELKNKLKELNEEENFLKHFNKHDKSVDYDLNKMQMVPYCPNVVLNPSLIVKDYDDENENENENENELLSSSSSSASSSETSIVNEYKIEEPSDLNLKYKNKLKRKYSQLNKISIEEMSNSNFISNYNNNVSNFYLVEHEDDLKLFSNQTQNFNQQKNVYITEIVDNQANIIGTPVGYEQEVDEQEEMEL